ncbi:hypothetical protein AB0B63_23100 [Micromonospora sp. NPDC049081]|uniref:hypothetical protein n=1 Tax=Micromonospora sp. NPDC049081 TaxID=3155150 RepID=UPI0033D2FD3D
MTPTTPTRRDSAAMGAAAARQTASHRQRRRPTTLLTVPAGRRSTQRTVSRTSGSAAAMPANDHAKAVFPLSTGRGGSDRSTAAVTAMVVTTRVSATATASGGRHHAVTHGRVIRW